MACSRFIAVAAGAALLAFTQSAVAQSSPQALEQVIDAAVAQVPACMGLAVGATQGDQHVQRFYGDAGNGGPPRPDTIFGIGGITKTLTATVLAFEDQAGAMHLNDPLARYGPQGAQYRVPAFKGTPIQLVHLAEHTSGLPRRIANPTPPVPFERLWLFVGHYQLQRRPGQEFLYSNLGFALLARAMVRHFGASEDELYAQVITRPLGLPDTAIALTPAQAARLARGVDANRQPAPEFGRGFPAMNGAGGARSTLDDMMRYLDFELGRIDTPLRAVLPVMHQPRHAAPSGAIGLAWQMRDGPRGGIIFKDGLMPGYASYMAFSPQLGTGVVVLSNDAGCATAKIANQVMGGLNGLEGLNGGEMPELPTTDMEE